MVHLVVLAWVLGRRLKRSSTFLGQRAPQSKSWLRLWTVMMMMMMQMSGSKQYKPLDETTAPADVAATQEEDTKKGCTR